MIHWLTETAIPQETIQFFNKHIKTESSQTFASLFHCVVWTLMTAPHQFTNFTTIFYTLIHLASQKWLFAQWQTLTSPKLLFAQWQTLTSPRRDYLHSDKLLHLPKVTICTVTNFYISQKLLSAQWQTFTSPRSYYLHSDKLLPVTNCTVLEVRVSLQVMEAA